MSRHARALETNTKDLLVDAVHQHRPWSVDGVLERSFTLAFSQLVYAQIWEDPVVDMEALQITPDSRILTIASGGCNVGSYLTANPAQITAVDLNAAHVALNKLKIAALRYIPDYPTFHGFFARRNNPRNVDVYERLLRDNLDVRTRTYWDSRDLTGRRRITRFNRNIYSYGLLGKFIGIAHGIGRLYGRNPSTLLAAKDHDEQIRMYQRDFAPLFERRAVKWLLDQKWSLYGLGIPPAQYDKLLGGKTMSDVLQQRLRKLACEFDFQENYFAQQAFGRGYSEAPDASLPPYLQETHFQVLKQRVANVDVHQRSFTEHLKRQPGRSIDCFVLLDAQDWMTRSELNALWGEISRVANTGARVIFRTADEPTLLPGMVSDTILNQWTYHKERSRELAEKDRSSIYGGFHLYELNN